MAEDLYTTRERAQFRGPTTSDRYNQRIENTFKDLAFLHNRAAVAEETLAEYQRQAHKNLVSLEKMVSQLESRLAALEGNGILFGLDNDDTGRFDGDSVYEVAEADRLTIQPRFGLVTLPQILGGSESRIRVSDSTGKYYLPSSLNVVAQGVTGSADSSTATINESNIYNAFLNKPGHVWERNVIVGAPDADGAIVEVFIGMPVGVSHSLRANLLTLDPFPAFGVDLLSVEYSTKPVVNLNDSDEYTPLNYKGLYNGDTLAVEHVPPGMWPGDEIMNAGPLAFHFEPLNITAIKLTLRTRNYYTEDGQVIYTYGLNDFDLRSEKHLDEGKIIFRLDAPEGQTISSVNGVTANIFNVSPVEAQEVFDYRVIWETAFDSGTYTETPVSASTRVWVEVTLRKTANGGTPALSALHVDYS